MKLRHYLDMMELALKEPTHYQKGWAKWNGKSWGWDCIGLIKSILWGWVGDESKYHGGGIYESNGVPDTTEKGLLNNCTDVSNDFTNLVPGEYLYMNGHAGTYIGNGQVVECTINHLFKVDGVVKTQIGSKGERLYNGKQGGSWEKHGKLRWVEYDETQTYVVQGDTIKDIANKFKVTEQAIIDVNNIQDNKIYVGQELIIPESKIEYTIINAPAGVWCRLDGYGLDKPKYKVIPYKTKCVLLQKNIGTADGYNWDKIIYDDRVVFLPNRWSLYE